MSKYDKNTTSKESLGVVDNLEQAIPKYSCPNCDDFETQEDLDRHIMEEHK